MARGSKGKYWITGFVLMLIFIIIVAAVSFNSQSRKPKVSEYLKIEHTKSLGTFSNQNRTVTIKVLGLSITANGGDAHSILIEMSSADEPFQIDFLANGSSTSISIDLKGYVTGINETVHCFPVELTIGCREATPEDITLYLKPEDIVGI